ncbi:unnamed protein product (macronuclear) [Paramecium tetraurelia]|uniref:Uncharacterized protein n=1 Tax=Paramecium tetraurelia TaxID=5888 RepID=A0E298_PARTE|nr:uncharacterized protein GSPATT00022587001 [Paramecium tetraurelia]CAK89415.1 unnamed protein product [Paramecium tetraurelia]|eukprot:XP_001456812.1 hypothetical protein (macronuclear) [Paramecium tetraurelia strain d4-2]
MNQIQSTQKLWLLSADTTNYAKSAVSPYYRLAIQKNQDNIRVKYFETNVFSKEKIEEVLNSINYVYLQFKLKLAQEFRTPNLMEKQIFNFNRLQFDFSNFYLISNSRLGFHILLFKCKNQKQRENVLSNNLLIYRKDEFNF